MRGLMMDYEMTIPAILQRAEALFGHVEIVGRFADRSIHRYRYRDMIPRAKRLAVALKALGVEPGDRVATLAWNHHQHLEAYFAIPSIGAVLHTLNLRLHPTELTYIVNHAEDRVVLVDENLLPLYEQIHTPTIEHVIVMGSAGNLPKGAIAYEELLAGSDPDAFEYPVLDERDAAAMCYTSGTTGKAKGVLYSHRAMTFHCVNWAMADNVAVRQRDVILGAPPMFHINGWGLAFIAAMVGAKIVLPGRFLDPESLLELIASERVTLGAGVPTVWLGVVQTLDANPGVYDVSSLERIASGGSAPPLALMRALRDRYGVTIIHIWGMTEMTASGTVALLPHDLEHLPLEAKDKWRARQGVPEPFIEIRARGEDGLIPWDGEAMGELEVRGPNVAREYYKNPAANSCFTDDGWLKTGDIVTIDPRGSIELRDRSKDLIKSGGEWISSVALENALMGHPAVAEAAVVAVPHPRWGERPLACVVVKPGATVSTDDLRQHLASDFAKWMLPDAFEFVETIPRTSTGKFLKSALRDRFGEFYAPGAQQT